MLSCFDNSLDTHKLDRDSFLFGHKLLNHPTLSLENLARVLPRLPQNQVMYSRRMLRTEDNFEQTFSKKPLDCSIEETIESIRTTDSYIMVSSPEQDPSFADLYASVLKDVEELIRLRGVGTRATSPELYLFIASPNSVTPFHIDRYSTILMQFRGSKTVSVFPMWDERVVPAKSLENYVAYQSTKLAWQDSMNSIGKSYRFSPGEALHIPFAAGHHVKNGPDDVSISMSIIFNTDESNRWREALRMNHALRKRLAFVNYAPTPVGQQPLRDVCKSALWKVAYRLGKLRPGR
jgi:Cupin-like domain